MNQEENSLKERNSYKGFMLRLTPVKDCFKHLSFAVFIHKFDYYNLLILDTSECFVYF